MNAHRQQSVAIRVEKWSPKRLFAALVSACLWMMALFSSQALHATTYATAVSAVDWQVTSSVFECQLSQRITGYGSGAFSHQAGESANFYLLQKNIVLPAGEAKIRYTQPSWHVDAVPDVIGTATVTSDKKPLVLDAAFAQKLLAKLDKGKRIVITRSNDDKTQPVHVVLDPLKFTAAYSQYRACEKRLLPVNYAQVSRTTLYFGDASDNWLKDETRKLDWLVQYIKADKGIKRILVDGHTDSVGPRPENLDISQLRAEHVASYLTAAGVNADAITTRWHGERYPIANNNSSQGRQKNRRVTVRLKRDN